MLRIKLMRQLSSTSLSNVLTYNVPRVQPLCIGRCLHSIPVFHHPCVKCEVMATDSKTMKHVLRMLPNLSSRCPGGVLNELRPIMVPSKSG